MGDLRVSVDPDHGGRWTSLIGPSGREWLHHREMPERLTARPEGDGLTVHGDGYRLHRQISEGAEHVVASYVLSARPGWRFLWAGHALLELSTSARLEAPGGHPT